MYISIKTAHVLDRYNSFSKIKNDEKLLSFPSFSSSPNKTTISFMTAGI